MRAYRLVLVLSLAIPSVAMGPRLEIQVLSEEGQPLPDVPVLQAQLERPFISVRAVGETDRAGRFAVAFENRASASDGDRGYGVYRFLLTPKDHPWALSDLYVWAVEGGPLGDGLRYLEIHRSDEDSNWNYGARRLLSPSDALSWSVSLPDKRPVRVAVWDDWGFQVPNATLRVSVDLGALSHTGYGAEIPFGEFKTDDDGLFTLPNAGDFVYSFDMQDGGCIAPNPFYFTSVLSKKLGGSGATLVYHRLTAVPLRITVTDAASASPVAGATVAHLISFPTAAQGGVIGTTGKDGRFSTDAFAPEHTFCLRIQAGGYADQDIPFVPGQQEYAVGLSSNRGVGG